MQLRLDAADRLVELVEERRGPVYAEEAARRLFGLRHVPAGMARSLLEDAVAADARLAWSGDSVRLATPPGHDLPLERATYVVVDLETTGLRPGTCRICEIGAVRVRELELGETFQTLANPGIALGRAVASLTGLRDRELRRAPPAAEAVRRFLGFAADPPHLPQALAGVRRADDARRLPLPRPPRPGALRRSRARPARQAALVLPDGSPAARGRGGTRRARADRVAGARLRARGGARGAPAHPRAAAAGERARRAARPLRLPPAPRRRARLLRAADRARPDPEPLARPPRRPRAHRRERGGARRSGARASAPPGEGARARRGPPLRGRCAAPRPRRGARARRRRAAASSSAPPRRVLPRRARARARLRPRRLRRGWAGRSGAERAAGLGRAPGGRRGPRRVPPRRALRPAGGRRRAPPRRDLPAPAAARAPRVPARRARDPRRGYTGGGSGTGSGMPGSKTGSTSCGWTRPSRV